MTDSAKELPDNSVSTGDRVPRLSPPLIVITQAPSEIYIGQPLEIIGTADFSQIKQVLVKLPNNSLLPVQVNSSTGQWRSQVPTGFPSAAAIYLKIQGLDHTQILRQELVVNVLVKPPLLQLLVKHPTIFKISPADSDTLPPDKKVNVRAGQSMEIVRYGMVDGHLKVLLKQPIAPVGEFGYFYAPHVDLVAPVTVTVKQDTVFKISTASSMSLPFTQKVTVKAGTKLLIASDYEIKNNHVSVKLIHPIAPVGNNGYFFLPHVELSKLNETIDFEPPDRLDDIPLTAAELTVTTDTFLKISSQNASDLANHQKILVRSGTSYPITGYASINGHFRVKLANPIAPVGNVGFFYWQHVVIRKKGMAIAYDPEMTTLKIRQNTVLKKRPLDSRQLSPQEMAPLKGGDIYGVDSYSISDIHFQVSLNEDIPPMDSTGYIFMGHVNLLQRGKPLVITPKSKVLGVPYFSQRDNPRDPFSTCNVTSIAMVMAFYGRRSRDPRQQLENELYQWIIDRYGSRAKTDNAVLQELYLAYGYQGGFSTQRTWAQIKQEILENRPVVIGGYFTHGGHIICIIGFDEHGYIVHDPYGNALTGYRQTEGRRLRYPYIYMRDMCGVDGDVWAHFIRR
jgi:hypothetical protein